MFDKTPCVNCGEPIGEKVKTCVPGGWAHWHCRMNELSDKRTKEILADEVLVGEDDMWTPGLACCTCGNARAHTEHHLVCTRQEGHGGTFALMHHRSKACMDHTANKEVDRDE